MEKLKTNTLPDSFVLPQFRTIAVLRLLLDQSTLNKTVIKHCKAGLKVVGIIYAHTHYNTGTQLLSRKEFDAFFTVFPEAYFKHRVLISPHTIIDHIEQCVKTNEIVNMAP